MGRYIDDILQPGEKVLYSTNAHWMFYLPAIAAWIVAIGFLVASRMIGIEALMLICLTLAAIAGLAALYLTVTAWFHRWTTETDVTNMRVVHKTGFITRQTFEMSLGQGRERRRRSEHCRSYSQLRQRHCPGRRRARGKNNDHCLATGLSQRHYHPTGRHLIMVMQQNSSAGFSAMGSTVDPAEVAKFSKLSDEWWDPRGKMAPLHKINPLRLSLYPRRRLPQVRAQRQEPELPVGPAHPRYRLRRRACCASRSRGSAPR